VATASATQAAQPHWMTPLVTVTPRLEQEFRADFFSQTLGKASRRRGESQRRGGDAGWGEGHRVLPLDRRNSAGLGGPGISGNLRARPRRSDDPLDHFATKDVGATSQATGDRTTADSQVKQKSARMLKITKAPEPRIYGFKVKCKASAFGYICPRRNVAKR
jgi:hypothetical protein